MKKSVFVLIFAFLVVGLITGFVIGATAFSAAKPSHPLQQVTTDQTGTVSVDADSNGIIDKSSGFDTVHCGTSQSIRETLTMTDYNGQTTGCGAGNWACLGTYCNGRGGYTLGSSLYWKNGNWFHVFECYRYTVITKCLQ